MRRFVHEDVNIILQRFVLSIAEHRQSLDYCQFLIPIVLIKVRVRLKIVSLFSQEMCNPSFLQACRVLLLERVS